MEFSWCINSSLGVPYPRQVADHMCTGKGTMTVSDDPQKMEEEVGILFVGYRL